jgi:hypothetical protein
LGGEGAERWRRRLKEENRDRVIVFVGDRYGIFHLAELSVLTGIRLKTLPAHLGTWQDVLARYGLAPAAPRRSPRLLPLPSLTSPPPPNSFLLGGCSLNHDIRKCQIQ